jgi:hypothetical protein
MRKVLLVAGVLFAACIQVARADVISNAAPADEYFGPYSQSVLEIRNRLNDFDQRDTNGMLDPSVPTYLDHLQLAIRDWQQKYPRDPWIAPVLAHLIREYWRAGQSSSQTGMTALADLRSTYPDAPITSETVAMVYGSNGDLAASSDGVDVARSAYEAPPQEAPPVEGALPSYAVPDPQAPPQYEAPPPEEGPPQYEAPPAQEGPPQYDASLVEQAPPAEQAPLAEQAPPPDESAGPNATSYDAARGYDPVHGYDAARGYDVVRGVSASQSADAARNYGSTQVSNALPPP